MLLTTTGPLRCLLRQRPRRRCRRLHLVRAQGRGRQGDGCPPFCRREWRFCEGARIRARLHRQHPRCGGGLPVDGVHEVGSTVFHTCPLYKRYSDAVDSSACSKSMAVSPPLASSTNLSPGPTRCLSSATAPSSGACTASNKDHLQIVQLAVNKSMKPQITLLPMSDAQEAAEAVKKNELKDKYGFVLTQTLEAEEKYVKEKNKQIRGCFDIRACIIADLRHCTLLNVKDVAVLPTDAYPHVLTSNINFDPILTNSVSISPSLDHLIKANISRRTHSYRCLFTPSTRGSLLRGLKVAPHRKSQG
jgi:hypothetical protein